MPLPLTQDEGFISMPLLVVWFVAPAVLALVNSSPEVAD